MHNSNFHNRNIHNGPTSSVSTAGSALSDQNFKQAARTFNTAVISSRKKHGAGLSDQLQELRSSTEFQSIIGAAQELAQRENIDLKSASERILGTFRKIDEIWDQFVYAEGLEKLKSRG